MVHRKRLQRRDVHGRRVYGRGHDADQSRGVHGVKGESLVVPR